MDIDTNEIRDSLRRAHKRWHIDGGRTVKTMHVRLKWQSDIARVTIDDRINRRAGLESPWRPFRSPVCKSISRNRRRQLIRLGKRRMF